MTVPRRFYLQRDTDITGVSGTGRVADGVMWADGTASVCWIGDRPSIVFWDKGMADAEFIHGHDGATRIVWLDGPEEVIDPDLPCMNCLDGHPDPAGRSWGVRVSPQRGLDGRPSHLLVQPSNGTHVANEDAVWLQQVIRAANSGPAA